MDFTNINDPAGIKALLDQLRASQAWQETDTGVDGPQADGNPSDRDSTPGPPLDVPDPVTDLQPLPSVSSHISSLLSRLQPGVSASSSPLPEDPSKSHGYYGAHQESALSSSLSKSRDSKNYPDDNPTTRHSLDKTKSLRSLPFIQALPIVASLAEDPAFIKKIEKMRKDQELLEQKLWKDRGQILQNQQEKITVAQIRAAMVGTGLDPRDASALASSFSKELKAFDSDQALPAWDALVSKQQGALEALGVPSMFVTALRANREKQMRIIQVLDGLSGSEDEEIPVVP